MKKQLLTIILLAFFSFTGYSQNCGTEPTPEQIKYLDKTKEKRQYYTGHKSKMNATRIPVQIHMIRRSNGTGGLSSSQVTSVINNMNSYFANANIEFYQCQAINYINSSTYYDFNTSNEGALAGSNDVLNVINIYFFNSITTGTFALCGYTRLPPSTDRIFMANSCAMNGTTMTHEMGHYFSLYHTHGKTNTGTTDELVNGSNCTFRGDDICDTPADPNLSGLVNSGCNYIGTARDANGDLYNPDTRNIMSYGRKSCFNRLSTGQYNRIAFSLANDRNYLTCSGGGSTPTYCTSNATRSIDTEVERVQFNTINKSSANNCTGYSDYTNISTSVNLGQSYTLTVTTGDCDGGSAYQRGFAAYIDWNADGDFTDSGERVLYQANGSTISASATVTVPNGATNGATRMRVITVEGGVTSSCGSYSYGETEDYTVNIGGSSADAINVKNEPSLENLISIYPNPTNGKLNLDINTNGDHQVSYALYDLVGKAIETNSLSNTGSYTSTLDLGHLQRGTYFLNVTIDGKSTIHKVVLEK